MRKVKTGALYSSLAAGNGICALISLITGIVKANSTTRMIFDDYGREMRMNFGGSNQDGIVIACFILASALLLIAALFVIAAVQNSAKDGMLTFKGSSRPAAPGRSFAEPAENSFAPEQNAAKPRMTEETAAAPANEEQKAAEPVQSAEAAQQPKAGQETAAQEKPESGQPEQDEPIEAIDIVEVQSVMPALPADAGTLENEEETLAE